MPENFEDARWQDTRAFQAGSTEADEIKKMLAMYQQPEAGSEDQTNSAEQAGEAKYISADTDIAKQIQDAVREFDNGPDAVNIEPGSQQALEIEAKLRSEGKGELADRLFGENQELTAEQRQAKALQDKRRMEIHQERIFEKQREENEIARLRKELEGGDEEEVLPIRKF